MSTPTSVIKTVAVFCGSKPGRLPYYMNSASRLGEVLASKGISLVYGGGCAGCMGAVAKAVQDGGAKVTGIVPTDLGRCFWCRSSYRIWIVLSGY